MKLVRQNSLFRDLWWIRWVLIKKQNSICYRKRSKICTIFKSFLKIKTVITEFLQSKLKKLNNTLNMHAILFPLYVQALAMRRHKPGISNCFVLSGTRTNPARPFRSPDRRPHRFALNARSTRCPRLRVRAWRGPCWWVRWFADLWRVHRWPRSQMGLYWKSMSTVAPPRVCIGPHGKRCTAELNSSRLLVRTCVIPLHLQRMCECELTSPTRMQSLTSRF